MPRPLSASVAVLSVLYAFSAAPFTHAHDADESAADGGHPHTGTLVHSHATPHSVGTSHTHHNDEHDAEHSAPAIPDGYEQIWSVGNFVFQPPVSNDSPAPILDVAGELAVELTSTWGGALRPQPRAHGPPPACSFLLRAPPAFLPALS